MPRPLARDALGLGLRTRHYRELHEPWPELQYFEIISENFLSDAEGPRYHLDRVRERYPIVLHGVGLNLLGSEPPSNHYLDRVAALAELVDAPFVTDHLCWTGSHGLSHHDLLPVPYLPELVELAAERARQVQQHLGRPFGLENLSSYVEFAASSMTEWDFYAGVVERADCWFMLDINNIYVSSQNHRFSASDYLARVDFSRVLQVHIAGHTREPNGTIIDTHDQPVADAVWKLYADAFRKQPFPTLLEWDAQIPPLADALSELWRAKAERA
ncbi:MAG TPA: DUF692 domain-containing protein [Polyangiaceae bacterium]|nr:DUF692 domain-containing protein [Polyangiaceae bacterium]